MRPFHPFVHYLAIGRLSLSNVKHFMTFGSSFFATRPQDIRSGRVSQLIFGGLDVCLFIMICQTRAFHPFLSPAARCSLSENTEHSLPAVHCCVERSLLILQSLANRRVSFYEDMSIPSVSSHLAVHSVATWLCILVEDTPKDRFLQLDASPLSGYIKRACSLLILAVHIIHNFLFWRLEVALIVGEALIFMVCDILLCHHAWSSGPSFILFC